MSADLIGQPYQYLPLKPNEIRLLYLFPQLDGNITILAQLVHVSLDDLPPYDSLSYCWGTEPSIEHISINGKVIAIQPNLAAALHQLSHHDEPPISKFRRILGRYFPNSKSKGFMICRSLWCDALCINQADPKERSQQIQLMCKIYECSSRLIVWLGLGHDDTEHAFEFLFALGKEVEKGEAAVNAMVEDCASTVLFGHTWVALIRLLSSPWFDRAWIIQELALGGKGRALFYCGAVIITEEELGALSKFYGQQYWARWNAWERDPSIATLLAENGYGHRDFVETYIRWSGVLTTGKSYDITSKDKTEVFDILYWLVLLRERTATNPRDKVYATLGLVNCYGKPLGSDLDQLRALLVDYNATIQDVYSSVVKEMVIQTKRLHILLACSERGPNIQRTWTPDWSYEGFPVGFLTFTCGLYYSTICEGFAASLESECIASFAEDLSTMTVRGFQCDVVESVSPSPRTRSEMGNSPITDEFLRYCENLWADPTLYTGPSADANILRRLWTSLLINRHGVIVTNDILPPSSAPSPSNNEENPTSPAYKSFPRSLTRALSLCTQQSSWTTPALQNTLDQALQPWHRIFRTTRGYIGKHFSHDLQIGDVVCILLGCPTPMVLRSVKEHFELLGGVYVDGVMWGEAIGMPDEGEGGLRDFEMW